MKVKFLTFVLVAALLIGAGIYFFGPKGGSYLVLQPQEVENQNLSQIMPQISQIVVNRLKKIYSEKIVLTADNEIAQVGTKAPIRVYQIEDNKVVVRTPGMKIDAKSADLIAKRGRLEFKNEAGEVVLTGDKLKKAEAFFSPKVNEPVIHLEFTRDGRRLFAQVTKNSIGNKLAVCLDDEVLTEPKVEDEIKSGQAIITGFDSIKEAQDKAILLEAESYPVPVRITKNKVIGSVQGTVIDLTLHIKESQLYDKLKRKVSDFINQLLSKI